MTSVKRPLCAQCKDGTPGYLEDEFGNLLRRCPCRNDAPNGEQRRAEGQQATAAANPDAMRAALQIITDYARRAPMVSSNDVRPAMNISNIPGPVRGAAFAQAVKMRYLRKSSYEQSTDPATHAHPVATYESLIYRPGRVSA